MEYVLNNINKRFAATQALDDVSAVFRAGEITAVVGENGAGKSTLLKVGSGIYPIDSGHIMYDGKPFVPQSYLHAASNGVVYVFQETTINPYLSVAENIFINRMREFSRGGFLNRKRINEAAQAILDDIEADFSTEDDLNSLNLGQWKLIEIARGLAYDPQVIFFDESTAFLNYNEVQMFLGVVRKLKKKQLAIGVVSHHMNELFDLADNAVILKDGRWVTDLKIADTTIAEVQNLMVGRELSTIYPPKSERQFSSNPDIALRLTDVSGLRTPRNISFDLRKGEVLGIGGLKGAGGDELLSLLYGDDHYTGLIEYNGEPYDPKNPVASVACGIAYLPSERTIEGLITDFSIKSNINMSRIRSTGFFVKDKEMDKTTDRFIDMLSIRTNSRTQECNALSGGNMQKVVISKCLSTDPTIILLNNPTRGIDVGARLDIYNIIHQLALQGVSILLLSEDLEELIGMSDRIMILKNGQMTAMIEDDMTEHNLIKYMI